MMHPPDPVLRPPRHGIILLVVVSLLTLFALVGITFVLYSDAAAISSRIFREAEAPSRPDMDPEMLAGFFLGQLLYDVHDDESGVYSALRGHSLARLVYGLNDQGVNAVPFNGTGRLRVQSVFFSDPLAPPEARDDSFLINYQAFLNASGVPVDGFLRDPERLGARPGLAAARMPFTGGFNVPYTYPDLNNLFLAAVRADGTVMLPSFHRPWTGFGPLDPGNPNWTDATKPWLKYMVLRPRPADHPGFPLPEDPTGDVKNLIGAPGGNDSIWIDLGAPVLTAPDGRRFKALFAPLILDLDGKVNVNVHGNIRGLGQTHVSNQGWGPWEVNLGKVLNVPVNPGEWRNLFITTAAPPRANRYGLDGVPSATANQAVPGKLPHFYGPVDYDASRWQATPPAYLPTGAPLLLPGTAPVVPFVSFPFFPPGYDNGSGGAVGTERWEHPLLYNVFRAAAFNPLNDDRTFSASNLAALLRYGDTGTEALTSELLTLCRLNFTDPTDPANAARRRRLVTTHSFDLDRPGVTPWVWDPATQPYFMPPGAWFPVGTPIPFPAPGARLGAVPANSEFSPDWRAVSAALGRLDLNRNLPDYPGLNPVTGRIDLPAGLEAFQAAQEARQLLAAEIFQRLRAVTGARDPNSPLPALVEPPPGDPNHNPERWNALRWLAQLAVNIVDYLDSDDYMTPFAWYTAPAPQPPAVVVGTELPRVLLNEAYAEYVNDPNDPGLGGPLPGRRASRFLVNVWSELHNPFQTAPSLADNGAAKLEMPAAGPAPAYGIYQLVLSRKNLGLRLPGNFLGDPDPPPAPPAPPQIYTVLSSFSPPPPTMLPPPPVPYPANPAGPPPVNPDPDPRFLLPVNGAYSAPNANGSNRGFSVVGPLAPFPDGADPGRPTPTLQRPEMTYSEVANAVQPIPPPLTILLRRLACPHLPPNDTPGPTYNPYVTVDYMEDVPLRNAADVGFTGPNPPVPVAERQSVGRAQPYAAHLSQRRPQLALPLRVNQPQHTFFRHNAREEVAPPQAATPNQTLKLPFDWLVHLDRQLISPMELLHVSGFKPHELTQQFVASFLLSSGTPVLAAGPTTITAATSGVLPNGTPWSIQVGSVLLVDPGTNEELVLVTAVTPADFTATFTRPHPVGFPIVGTQPFPFLQAAPWLDQTRRLYRALELLATRERASGLEAVTLPITLPGPLAPGPQVIALATSGTSPSGVPWHIGVGSWPAVADPVPGSVPVVTEYVVVTAATPTSITATFRLPHAATLQLLLPTTGDRIPGRINLNTIWDLETFRALCDRQEANGFTDAQVDVLFAQLLASRSRGPAGTPSPADRPFRGLGTAFAQAGDPQYPLGSGLEDTLLRSTAGPGTPPLFAVPGATHPYQQAELLTKIFNRVTTRSNVFAVWLTVGFFEVTDETVRPVRLGAELGRSENRHIRHRMFAIVDRSNLAVPPDPNLGSAGHTVLQGPIALPPGPKTVPLAALTGTVHLLAPPDASWSWSIQPGTSLEVGTGANRETVVVLAVDPAAATITAAFNLAHGTGEPVTLVGNPGPQPQFNPRANNAVVPYFSLID
jgi:hypothetical protein